MIVYMAEIVKHFNSEVFDEIRLWLHDSFAMALKFRVETTGGKPTKDAPVSSKIMRAEGILTSTATF